jgi:hypothetical protein
MNREEFLTIYLSAHGAQEIAWNAINIKFISGRVIYDPSDKDEYQDFIWHFPDDQVLNQDVFNLMKLIKNENLLNIDKLKINEEDLRDLFNKTYHVKYSFEEFTKIFDELLDISVDMVDDGEETDTYYIHL